MVECTSDNCKLKNPQTGELLSLGVSTILGRSEDCDIVLKSDIASRRHASIELKAGDLILNDEGSSNGTFLNGEKLSAPTSLFDGDIIVIDTDTFSVISPNKREAEADIPSVWSEGEGLESASQTQIVFDVERSAAVSDYMAGRIEIPPLGEVPRLVGLSDAVRGRIYELQGDQSTNIWHLGRSEEVDIVIDDGSVSGKHAQLVNDGVLWKIVNWMSTNGTFVNDKKGLSTFLKSGDIIRLGSVEFAFEARLSGGAATAKQAPPVSSGESSSKTGLIIGVLAVLLIAGAAAAFLL
ncbi:FHA domain-containing protein [Pseudoteredinibacter isoporae]|uniref:PSer/pThr/pTyr-binding forkhead associated (FHA) protein n=1 Tax=Pseudoteredinibacter isoporae TaxID=570281 RepID=A0A7X0JSL5_9GAMM|nr:FHA domain-containing protein [Pseudoteredinibacter isoporae]MBB6521533.1 pSer/pThr/pTyr-binding forkhead associated (FHA) protein [Pseudoteredinibacter isoporae]NHO87087.1 FHA domain-containing protein [Pseudoteredinibacter isoporae]NIB22834.1 FHA domain-containing protein [Pseudoteredinibacter isoporae]